MKEKEHVIELYELWTKIKSRFGIIAPQPKHFNLRKEVIPVTSLDGYTIKLIDLSDDTQVNSGGASNIQLLQPPAGFVYELIYLYYAATDPDGGGASTAGTHKLNIYYDGISTNSPLITASSNFGSTITITSGAMVASSETPASAELQFKLFTEGLIVATYDIPVEFIYKNSTDKNQVDNRVCEIIVKKRPEGAY